MKLITRKTVLAAGDTTKTVHLPSNAQLVGASVMLIDGVPHSVVVYAEPSAVEGVNMIFGAQPPRGRG